MHQKKIIYSALLVGLIIIARTVLNSGPQSLHTKHIYITAGTFGNVFDPNPKIGNTQTSCCKLKQELDSHGYDIKQVRTIRHLNEPAAIIFFDICANVVDLEAYPIEKRILFLWEPPSVLAQGYNPIFHAYFSKIYTWNDDLVDNKKYFKFYYPQPTFSMVEPIDFNHKKFCTLISCNKHSDHPQELYSERLKAIEFFQTNHPQDFDLYGMGWDNKTYPCYKGSINSKTDALKQYKFCICYENIKGLNGYITEKIFDCFIAGCVPIYWGAENITHYIPSNCFIDRRNFASLEDLYAHLKAITEEQYLAYLANIRQFLASPAAELFSCQHFIKLFFLAIAADPLANQDAKFAMQQNGALRAIGSN